MNRYVVPVESDNTVPSVLVRQAEALGGKTLVSFPREGHAISYAGLVESAEAASTRLLDTFGLERGMRGAILLGNRPVFIEAWFACLFAGIVDVPVNHEFRKTALLFALQIAETEILFTDGEGLEAVLDPEVAPWLAGTKLLVLTGEESALDAARRRPGLPASLRLVSLAELTRPGPRAGHWRRLEASALTSIRYTSGTTGKPKGIMHTHLHMLAKSMVQNRILDFSAADILYSPFPLHHNLTSINGLIGALQVGGSIACAERFSASRFWSEAGACGATLGHILLPLMSMLLSQPPHEDDRKHGVRLLWTAPRRADFCERFAVGVVNSYSLSEVGTISFQQDGGEEGSTATGVPTAEFDVQIVDPLDRPVEPGADGEIVVRTRHPHRMLLGYYNDLPATARAFRNLWYHTGDRGRLGPDGMLHFLGRMGDTIRRRGVNISSEQVTSEVLRHPAISLCAILGVPAGPGDEEVLAVLVLNDGYGRTTTTLAEIARFLDGRLPRELVPRYFEITDSLPQTGTGKVQVAQVRARARGGPRWDRTLAAWTKPA